MLTINGAIQQNAKARFMGGAAVCSVSQTAAKTGGQLSARTAGGFPKDAALPGYASGDYAPSMSNRGAVVERVRYVNTASSSGGDGTTNNTTGSTKAYASLYDCLNAEKNNGLINQNTRLTIYCEGSTADTSEPVVSSQFLTDSTRYITITVDQTVRHDGKWNTGKYRIANSQYYGVIEVQASNVRIYGLQLEQQKTSASGGTAASGVGLRAQKPNAYYIIDSCVMRYTGDYTNQTANGVDTDLLFDNSGHTLIVANCVIYDYNQGLYLRVSSGSVYAAYNNTIHNSHSNGINYSYSPSTSNLRLYNNICQSSATKDYEDNASSGGTFSHATNISEDATSPDASFRSKVVTFANEASDDFHLGSSDTQAKDLGTSLAADAYYPFNWDVDGNTRSGSWDIGGDEYVSLDVTGTIAQTLASHTQSVAAKSVSVATVANTLASVSQSVSAKSVSSASVANTLASHTQAVTAKSVSVATVSNTLASHTQSVSAKSVSVASIANTLASVAQSLSANVPANATATIAQTLASHTQSVNAKSVSVATVANTLASVSQSVAAKSDNIASVTNTLSSHTQSAAAKSVSIATASNVLASHSQSITAKSVSAASVSQTLASVSQSAAAESVSVAAVAQTLQPIAQSVTAKSISVASVGNTLASVSQNVIANVETGDRTAIVAQTLAPASQSVAAKSVSVATIGNVLQPVAQSAQAKSRNIIAAANTLASVTQAVSALNRVSGTASTTLASVSQSAQGTVHYVAVSAQSLSGVSQSATANIRIQAVAAQIVGPIQSSVQAQSVSQGSISQALSAAQTAVATTVVSPAEFVIKIQKANSRDFILPASGIRFVERGEQREFIAPASPAEYNQESKDRDDLRKSRSR